MTTRPKYQRDAPHHVCSCHIITEERRRASDPTVSVWIDRAFGVGGNAGPACGTGISTSLKRMEHSPRAARQAPPLPFCHLCGRQFGTTLGIRKACKRWEREQPPRTRRARRCQSAPERARGVEAFRRRHRSLTTRRCCRAHTAGGRLKDARSTCACGRGHFADQRCGRLRAAVALMQPPQASADDDGGKQQIRRRCHCAEPSRRQRSRACQHSAPFRPPPSAPSPSAR